MVLKEKTSVQEVSLLINQEHEIFYNVSKSIFLCIVIKEFYEIFVKREMFTKIQS